MKYLLAIVIGLFATTVVYAEAETKKACVKQVDPKTKKEKEVKSKQKEINYSSSSSSKLSESESQS